MAKEEDKTAIDILEGMSADDFLMHFSNRLLTHEEDPLVLKRNLRIKRMQYFTLTIYCLLILAVQTFAVLFLWKSSLKGRKLILDDLWHWILRIGLCLVPLKTLQNDFECILTLRSINDSGLRKPSSKVTWSYIVTSYRVLLNGFANIIFLSIIWTTNRDGSETILNQLINFGAIQSIITLDNSLKFVYNEKN